MTSVEKIEIAAQYMSDNLDTLTQDKRGLLSQNILANLRSFVEAVAFKEYEDSLGVVLEDTYQNIEKANHYVQTKSSLNFLDKFHKFLQIVASHVVLDSENSERLMLKYYEYLLKIKIHLRDSHGIRVLGNLYKFPRDIDPKFNEYYSKISLKVDRYTQPRNNGERHDRYYIHKIKPVIIDEQIFYEVTLTMANDFASKFDRIIAFSKHDIIDNYAIDATLVDTYINIYDRNMPIKIIKDWDVAIRKCEFENFYKLLGQDKKINTHTKEYLQLMQFIKRTGLSLSDLVALDDLYYNEYKNEITADCKSIVIFEMLDLVRKIIINNHSGCNVLKYLLFIMNNKIIKHQFSRESCDLLSNLYLNVKCKPFDEMPFVTSLVSHNPRGIDIFKSIGIEQHLCEMPVRKIKYNLENNGKLYTHKDELVSFKNLDELIKLYNNSLYWRHQSRAIDSYKDFYYLRGYEEDALNILKNLKDITNEGIQDYEKSFNSWLQESSYVIDCVEKQKILTNMFSKSKLAMIYGAAGTGKTTLINHISNFFADKEKIFLTNTNPAKNNLRRKVNAPSCEFSTITNYLALYTSRETDILIIDECSTVGNKDMIDILNRTNFKLLILVGDVYQIESITFGNWFRMAKYFVPKQAIHELTTPYRSDNQQLITFWNKVRNLDDDIAEHIARNRYSAPLDESIFTQPTSEEIILCLNYDGLYGINNINRFLQAGNKNKAFNWGIGTYKVGDPILFNDNQRFAPVIYNNLKGTILDIEVIENKIRFDIEIDTVLNALDVEDLDLALIENKKKDKSTIRFFVNMYKSNDEDDQLAEKNLVPFQVAYAVSIHKAQGLEYDSVKVIITREIEELITHNIFYTAITRSKNKLKIYWSPECQKKILQSFKDQSKDVKDIFVFGGKFQLKANKF